MFVAASHNTMRNARPKFVVRDQPIVRTVEQMRADRRYQAAEERRLSAIEWAKHAEANRLAAISAAEQASAIHRYRTITVNWREPAKAIIERFAANNNVQVAALLGDCRSHWLVALRFQVIREVADARPDMSLVAMGRIFNRDHTSLLHALRKTKKPGQHR